MADKHKNRYFTLVVPVDPKGNSTSAKRSWLKIGYATEYEPGSFGCTILSIPLNWNGEFFMHANDKTKPETTSEGAKALAPERVDAALKHEVGKD